MDNFGVTAAEAGRALAALGAQLNASSATCTVAEFNSDPDRYLTEWMGGVAAIYMAAVRT